MTRERFTNVGTLGLTALGLVLAAVVLAGCASTKKQQPATPPVVAETKAPEPDRIGFIELKPWAANPGETVQATLSGTGGRTATLTLTGVEGEANGKTKTVNLTPAEAGTYTGSLTVGSDLPPGKYRVEGQLAGGPAGEPVRLVSSRALTVNAPPPPKPTETACQAAAKALAEPRIHFAFNESDITPETTAYVKDVAAQLAKLGKQVTQVTIEGHCDERGTVNYNLALGGRRAKAVEKLLRAQPGAQGLDIATKSWGKEKPVVPNAQTEDQHAQNRRADFVVECAPGQ